MNIVEKLPSSIGLFSVLHTKTLRMLVRPLVTLCLRHAVKIQDLEEAIKEEFVCQAINQLEGLGATASVSRISAMTGIHRREISRIQEPNPDHLLGSSLISRIIGQWQTDRRFTAEDGRGPRALRYEGKDSEFSRLVSAVSSDLNPYTVLFEMERLGTIKRTDRGLRLRVDALVRRDDIDEGLQLLAADTSDLFEAVSDNLIDSLREPHLHLKTEFDNIRIDRLEEIRSWLVTEGSKLHKRAREFISKFDLDINPEPVQRSGHSSPKGGGRVAFSTFSLTKLGSNEKN